VAFTAGSDLGAIKKLLAAALVGRVITISAFKSGKRRT